MKYLVDKIKKNQVTDNLVLAVLIASFLLAFTTLTKVLNVAHMGVDLTDEGYYFNWISNPWLYQYYASQFGYIYHPIYKALGDSIVQLRQANTLISFVLAWYLSYSVLKNYWHNVSKNTLIFTSASIALPALYILMITGHWVPTPSYNSLNFQGCLIAALGFFIATKLNAKPWLAMILIGLGGWLVFMAKPSSALLLAIAAVLFFVTSLRKDWRILLGATVVSVAMLILSAYLIDGSMTQFIKRYQGGLQLMSAMDSGHGLHRLFKMDFFSISSVFKLKWLVLTALLFLLIKTVYKGSSRAKLAVALFSLLAVIIALSQMFHLSTDASNAPKYHTLIITALLFASIIYYRFNKAKAALGSEKRLLILLIALPYIYAAGTGNNYWQTGAGAALFWVLAAIILFAKCQLNYQLMAVITSFVAVIGSINIVDAMQTPYRQTDPLFQQTATYIDPHTKQTLVLSKDTAKYLNKLSKLLDKTHFMPNTPVIDLSGHHPGSLYFMQANAIGQAWTIGGYAGSQPLAALALNQATCKEIASAWLLVELEGKRGISEYILKDHGLDSSIDKYQVVAGLKSQTLRDFGSISPKHPDGRYNHYLLKPLDIQQQTKKCLTYRAEQTTPLLPYNNIISSQP